MPVSTDTLPGPLTRRGWCLGVVTAACFLGGLYFGARTLDAIVAPALVALVAAVLVIRRADRPTVRRTLPDPGAPGDGGEVALAIDADDRGVSTVRERVPDGLTASETTFDVSSGEATVRYWLTYDRRGVYSLGPVTVTTTDVLGLARREFEVSPADHEVVVSPTLVSPPEHVLAALGGVFDTEHHHGRDEFESLREYERGDALRDVDWKASAKRPDDELVVTEFDSETPTASLSLGVEATGALPTIDAAATAAASLAVHALDDGVEVGLTLSEETIEPAAGRRQRREILVALARLSSGSLSESVEDDVRVTAADGDATVVVDGDPVSFGLSSGARDSRAVRA